jgi:putative tryptophan/tyrosine transport system substrate-binding protein
MRGSWPFRPGRRWPIWAGLVLIGLAVVAGWALGPPRAPRPPKVARLGLLCHQCPEGSTSADFPPNSVSVPGALLDELRTLHWVEGENLVLEWRGAAGEEGRLAGLAAELVALGPDVLFSFSGTPPALALQRAAGTAPIVFFSVGDPVGSGLVASIPHPGGRLTGTSNFSPENAAKRLQLLQEAVPGVRRVGVVWNLGNPSMGPEWIETQRGAELLGITLQMYDTRDAAQIEAAFAQIAAAIEAGQQPPDALLVGGDGLFMANSVRVTQLVEQTGRPALYTSGAMVRLVPGGGGLMYFGADGLALARRNAYQIDRILRGTTPSDLPVEAPATFELVINLGGARRIGFEVPQSLLDRATEIIQ